MKKKYKLEFALFLISLVLIAIISTKYYFRLDTTDKKVYSLSKYTKQMIDNLESPLTITWFKSDFVLNFFPSLKYLEDLLLEYELYGEDKILIFTKNTSKMSEEKIKNLGLITRQIKSKNINSSTVYSNYSGLLIEYKGKSRVIPFIDDIDILEYDIARFVEDINLVDSGQYTKKTLAVLAPKDSLEGDYSFIIAWLDYAGFEVIPLSVPIDYIPENIPLLVIGSSYLDFSSAVAIDTFLKKDGNAVFFVSGNTVNYKTDWKAQPKISDYLLPVLSKAGFGINSDLVLDLINYRIEMGATDNSGSKFINYPFWLQLDGNNIKKQHPIFSGYKNLQTFWPSSINILDSSIVVLAKTTPKGISLTDQYDTNPFGDQLSLFSELDSSSKIIIAEKKGKNRILVMSDEYMISKAIDFTGSSYNMDFMVNCIEYILGKDNLIFLKNKQHTAPAFKKFKNNEEFLSIVFKARLLNLVILPLCIFGFGIYILVLNRKEK